MNILVFCLYRKSIGMEIMSLFPGIYIYNLRVLKLGDSGWGESTQKIRKRKSFGVEEGWGVGRKVRLKLMALGMD